MGRWAETSQISIRDASPDPDHLAVPPRYADRSFYAAGKQDDAKLYQLPRGVNSLEVHPCYFRRIYIRPPWLSTMACERSHICPTGFEFRTTEFEVGSVRLGVGTVGSLGSRCSEEDGTPG